MRLQIVRRALRAGYAGWGAQLHPVLQRAYAARGVGSALDLDHSLERLLPNSEGNTPRWTAIPIGNR